MNNSQKQTDAVGREVNVWREELGRLAGEVKLQLHLGGMEAKEAWKRLEPKLQQFEQDAEKLSEEVAHEFKEMGAALKKELQKLRDSLNET